MRTLVLAIAAVGTLLLAGTRLVADSCVGDCDGRGEVTVDEIITMVNIALGSASTTACTRGDENRDGEITVDEIVTAVNGALNGCASHFVMAEYVPLGEADRWVSRVTERSCGGPITYIETETTDHSACKSIDPDAVGLDDHPDLGCWSNTQGIRLHVNYLDDPEETVRYAPPAIIYPATMSKGEVYRFPGAGGTADAILPDGTHAALTVESVLEDVIAVVVPAGEFPNCLQLLTTLTYSPPSAPAERFLFRRWLAKGVGRVKEVESPDLLCDNSEPADRELLEADVGGVHYAPH